MRRLHKKILGTTLALAFAASSLLATAQASELDLEKRQEMIQKKIQETESLLSQKKKEENKALLELKQLNNVLSTAEKQLRTTETSLNKTEKDLNYLEKELRETEARLETNSKALEERLKIIYEQGEVQPLEVLLNSTGITDFLTRWDLLSFLAKNDAQLIDGIKKELTAYQEKQRIAEMKKAALSNLRVEQDERKHEIKVASSRQKEVLKSVQSEKDSIQKALDQLEEESRKIAQEIRRLTIGDSSKYQGSGKMAWPTPGYSRITSPYGWRVHPILRTKRLHTGIDIGAPNGAAIKAVESGTVMDVGWMGGYGRTVIISHGGDIVTLYAHTSAVLVQAGDTVTRGQAIARAGSTGWATGPHLHFEVRVGGEPVNPIQYLK